MTEEREKARLVVEQLQRWDGERLALEAVLWEELPLPADASFQEGIVVNTGSKERSSHDAPNSSDIFIV